MIPERFTLLYLLLCFADIYMLHRFFAVMFEKRYKRHEMFMRYLFFSFLAFIVNSFGISLLNLLILPIIYGIYAVWGFRISLANGVIYTFIFYAIFAGGEAFFEIWHLFLAENNMFPVVSWRLGEGTAFLLISYTLRFLFLLFIEQFSKKIEINRGEHHEWCLLFVPVVSLTILVSFMYMEFPEQFILQIVFSIGALLLYLLNAVMFIILERYTVVMNQIKTEELQKTKQEMEEERIQNIIRLNENYRCYIHDVHSYFSHLRMLALKGQTMEIVSMIDGMEGEMQSETKGSVYSGNAALDAILTEREIKAKRSQVYLNIFVESFLRVDFISSADMISMFGNLIDNAIEAALKCREDCREVDVKFFMGNRHMLVMYVENHFCEALKKDGERLLTSKQDAGRHGLGIGIVKKTAERYGGALGIEIKGNIFAATLTLSAYEQNMTNNYSRKILE